MINLKKLKFISALLSSVMLFSAMPVINAEDAASGTYENLTYITIDKNSDSIADGIEITDCSDDAVSVTIPDEIDGLPVISIDRGAFLYHKNIQNLTLGKNVKIIEDTAFFRCEVLSTVNFNNSLETIEYRAFADCYLLKEIKLPDSVTTLGEGCFDGCDSIISVNVPASVTTMERGVFEGCESLTAITVDKNNPNYCSIDGVLFDKEIKTLFTYPCNKSGTEYTTPETVTTIGEWAFWNAVNLEKVILSQRTSEIQRDAFSGCKNLMSITINHVNCLIYPSICTIYNGLNADGYYFNGTIYGYEKSTAQKYATEYNKNFVSLGIYSVTDILYGDANDDGLVNIRDCAYIAGMLSKGQGSALPKKADYTRDNNVNIRDAASIAKDLSLGIL